MNIPETKEDLESINSHIVELMQTYLITKSNLYTKIKRKLKDIHFRLNEIEKARVYEIRESLIAYDMKEYSILGADEEMQRSCSERNVDKYLNS